MAKKTLALLLSAAMITSMMTACGGGEEKKEDAKDTETSETAKDDGADESSEEGSGEEIVLQVFDAHAYGLDQYAEMVEAFEKEHPGVKIEVQHAANDSSTLLQSRVNSGDIPDVFDVESGTSAKKYYEYAYDWTDDTDVTSLFQEDALATGMNDEGRVMSLPWTYENMGIDRKSVV